MAKTFVRISLATKFRVLFATAVVAIIAAALGVPWYFTERLVDEATEQAATQVAQLGLAEWVQRHPLKPRPESTLAAFFTAEGGGRRGPNFIPIDGRDQGHQLEGPAREAYRVFHEEHHRTVAMIADEDDHGRRIYRCYRVARATASCRDCHDGQNNPAPAFAANQLVGMVEVALPPPPGAMIWWTRGVFLLGGLLAALLAFVVFTVITNQIILAPVRKLSGLAEKVAEGDLSGRSDIATGDEFERLGKRFNEMLDAIHAQQERLKQANMALDLRLGELAAVNVGLYETNRLKSEFLANVSHELRTPLNSIIGFAELLAETEDEKRRRHAGHILTSAKMLLSIINDLLDLARIEAGRADVRMEKVSVTDICETLSQLVRPLADKKNQQLVVELATHIPVLRTDQGKVQQVLYNLLSNAIKFTPPGGQITMRAKVLGADASPFQKDAVSIAVSDTGPGISAADQQRIWEKFHRLDNAMTREHGGAGLGLAISKELTALLGGRITLDSEPGHGATFTLLLPIDEGN